MSFIPRCIDYEGSHVNLLDENFAAGIGFGNSNTIHLDLGCGDRPRNPFRCHKLCGLDLQSSVGSSAGIDMRFANMCIDKIPFEDNYFDSVSAYDLLEHIPRILPGGVHGTRFPFIELMDEIWRVLKPGGVLFAITPAYPSIAAFQDPTHVNIITKETFRYFQANDPWGARYGLKGSFDIGINDWVLPFHAHNSGLSKTLIRLTRVYLLWRRTHLLWVWYANKHN